MKKSSQTLAASITRAASKQTYYTVRFLVDRERIPDAYRAYGYFRWLDDQLDQPESRELKRIAFVERQKDLMERLYRGETPRGLSDEERLLAELIQNDREKNSGLQSYIRNMMAVMVFDACRRGRLISQKELGEYVRWLATAVTEALHYFIGHDGSSPHNQARYLAASGAHITHMLRDMLDDIPAGYINMPREFLESQGAAASDVDSPACQKWVCSQVDMARACFKAGKDYLAQVENLRCRLAGYAYIARFEVVLDAIESNSYRLRADYPECRHGLAGLRMGWSILLQSVTTPRPGIAVRGLPEA